MKILHNQIRVILIIYFKIFDDMVNYCDQNLAENYYTRDSHNNISCINISQTYHILPRRKQYDPIQIV